jgi:hypothetical protein
MVWKLKWKICRFMVDSKYIDGWNVGDFCLNVNTNLLYYLGRPINFSYHLINSVIPRSFYLRDTYHTLV